MRASLDLVPETDVAWVDGRWYARSAAPWLRITGLERWRGRWLRLRYHAGIFDEHVRPLLRFSTGKDDDVTVPMNGALLGVGEWIGRVPDDTVAAAVSPVGRPGPFSFALASAHSVPRATLLARGLMADPRLTLTACGARVIGARAEARHCLSFAALATPMRRYSHWLAARSRPVDLDGFDRPASDWQRGPCVHLIGQTSAEPAAWKRTRASLAAQSYPHWRLELLDAITVEGIQALDPAAPLSILGSPGDIVATIHAGERLHPHALAFVVDHMTTNPLLDACYGDEDDENGEGRPVRPRLKPDPDPIRPGSPDGHADTLFWRLGAAPRTIGALAEATPPHGSLGHVRRLVHRRPTRSPGAPLREPPGEPPPVTVVIPTRDRARLLTACLEGLFTRTDHRGLEIVLVDNGSVEPEALAVLAEAVRRPNVQILPAPGAFNFAALCNAGAALASMPLLLFLNNDVTPLDPDWLPRLAALAVRPEVGAVGGRLLYPDGRLQHGGVVVGLGGTALHVHHRAQGGAGYLEQLETARTVGAVTGAVLMVERAKFETVDGFDAANFPVLLNDVDLCLRLRERGWHSVYEPAATLVHAESASRGRSARPFTLYARERRAFATRWAGVIRADPSFHPALSLTSTEPALG